MSPTRQDGNSVLLSDMSIAVNPELIFEIHRRVCKYEQLSHSQMHNSNIFYKKIHIIFRKLVASSESMLHREKIQ